MVTLPALRAPLPVLVDEVLALTAKLHPDEALARLGPVWATAKPGLARRALLAVRISLMRQAMTVAPRPEVVAEAPEVVAEVVPVFVPAPKPPVLNKGALTLLNLEDAARMLMAGADAGDTSDDSDASEAATATGVSEAAVAQAAIGAARADLSGVIAAEAAEAASTAKAKRPKARMVAPVALDLAAQFAGMEEARAEGDNAAVGAVVVEPAADVAARLAVLDAQDDAFVGVGDVSSGSISDGGGSDAPEAVVAQQTAKRAGAGGKPVAFDLSAQFAAMQQE